MEATIKRHNWQGDLLPDLGMDWSEFFAYYTAIGTELVGMTRPEYGSQIMVVETDW